MQDLNSNDNGRNDDGQLSEEEDERPDRVECRHPQDVVRQSREGLASAGTKVDAVNR